MGQSILFKITLNKRILLSAMASLILISPLSNAIEVSHFPGASEIQSQKTEKESYQLIMGQLKRIRGVMIPEKYQYVDATREIETFEIPKGRDVEDVYDHYINQIEGFGGKVLFECAGRGCGPANDWANKVFKVAKLYGPERFQHYAVFYKNKTLWVLYVSQRGNRTVMAHFETIKLDKPLKVQPPELQTVLKKLENQNRIILPEFKIIGKQLDVLSSSEGFEALEAAIRQYPDRNLSVVVHVNAGGGTAPQLAEISESIASQIESVLKQKGLRIYTIGVGPYTARYDSPYVIELVSF